MAKYFADSEFLCKDSCGEGIDKMDLDFVEKLDMLRQFLGFPFVLTSAYRCPTQNVKVSDTGPSGPHTTGHAVDIKAEGAQALAIVRDAPHFGFSGVGVQEKGEGRFIHLDDLTPPKFPRPTIWSY